MMPGTGDSSAQGSLQLHIHHNLQHDIFVMDEECKILVSALCVRAVMVLGKVEYRCDEPGCLHPAFETSDDTAKHVLDTHIRPYICMW